MNWPKAYQQWNYFVYDNMYIYIATIWIEHTNELLGWKLNVSLYHYLGTVAIKYVAWKQPHLRISRRTFKNNS